MIKYNTSSDKVYKIIRRWCKENRYIYSIDYEDKERNHEVYPFTICAPSYAEKDLMDVLAHQIE